MISYTRTLRGLGSTVLFISLALISVAGARGQQAPAAASAQAAQAGARLTATAANVTNAGEAVKIDILRWSTDEERTQLVVALTSPPAAAPPAAAAPAPASSGRGGAAASAAAAPAAAAGAPAARGDAARRAPAAASAPVDPVAAAIKKTPTVGYLWTSGVGGYSIKYAYRSLMPDGSERIILATDRRLGILNPPKWKPVSPSTTPNYEFTIIEVRLDAKGLGEGKASLNTKVTVDGEPKTLALESYAATPAIFKNVKR